MMDWKERIVIDRGILTGKPAIKGTRIAVELVLGLLAEGWSEEQVLASYPALTTEDVRACLSYANERLRSERVYPLPR